MAPASIASEYTKDETTRGYFVEMEHLFPDQPSFTFKGLAEARYPEWAEAHLFERLLELTRLMRGVLEEGATPSDLDFIWSASGVRWIDTGYWYKARHVNRDLQLVDLANVFRWAEIRKVGHGWLMYSSLRREIFASIVLSPKDKSELLTALDKYQVLFRKPYVSPLRRLIGWSAACARRLGAAR